MTTYFKILINDVDITDDVEECKVNKALGDINSSSNFAAEINNYKGDSSSLYEIGDEVKIYSEKGESNPSKQIFLGILEEISLAGKNLTERLVLKGRDYSVRLIDRTVEPEVYTEQTSGAIVADIISKYTDDITTTNVATGTNISRIVFNQIPVFDAIRQLAELEGYIFYIDNNKDLHFEEGGTVSSGLVFDNTNILKTSFKENRNEVFNQIWVYGDRYLDGYQETFTGDVGSLYTLEYKPHNTTINISGDSSEFQMQPGAIYEMAFSVGSDVKYLVNFESKEIVFTSGTYQGDNRNIGSFVTIDYMRDLPIVKVGENDSSISQYGQRVKVIQDTNIKDPLTAEAILLQALEDFSDPEKEGRLNVKDVDNVTPGETCLVDIGIYDMNNVTYKIIKGRYRFNKQTQLSDSVLEITVNKKITDITDTLKNVILELKRLQGANISDSDLLTRYKLSPGSMGIRQSGIEVWTQGIGSSFLLGHPVNALLGSYTSHSLGDWKPGSIIQWSGGYF